MSADDDGYVLGRMHGVAAYENAVLVSMAVRDDGDLAVPRHPENDESE